MAIAQAPAGLRFNEAIKKHMGYKINPKGQITRSQVDPSLPYEFKPDFRYELFWDWENDQRKIMCKEMGPLQVEEDLIWDDRKSRLLESIKRRIDENKPQSISCLFYGDPRSGKSTIARVIAQYAKAPIIVPKNTMDWDDIEFYLEALPKGQPYVLLCEEADTYNFGDYILDFLDGKDIDCLRIIIFTTNKGKEVIQRITKSSNTDPMEGRLEGRIHYRERFTAISGIFAIQQRLKPYKIHCAMEVADFIFKNFERPTEQNIKAFCKELQLFGLDKKKNLTENEMIGCADYLCFDLKTNAIEHKEEGLTMQSKISDLYLDYLEIHKHDNIAITKEKFLTKVAFKLQDVMYDPKPQQKSLLRYAKNVVNKTKD